MIAQFLLLLAMTNVAFGVETEEHPQLNFLKVIMNSVMSQMHEIGKEHLDNDPGFKAAIQYFQSDSFKNNLEEIRKIPEWIAAKENIKSLGVDVEQLVKNLTHCVEAHDLTNFNSTGIKPSLGFYLSDIGQKFSATVQKVFNANNNDIKNPFWESVLTKVANPKSRNQLETAWASAPFKAIFQKLEEMDVPIPIIKQFTYKVFSWK